MRKQAGDRFSDVVAITLPDLAEQHRRGNAIGGYYSAKAHADLQRALPQAKFVDADLLVNWIRFVKSPAELALMRQAGAIADAMMQRAVDATAAGVRECDIAAAVYYQMAAGTPEFGGSYMCAPLMLCVAERAVAPHAAWTDKPLPSSTTLNIDGGGGAGRWRCGLRCGAPSQLFGWMRGARLAALPLLLEERQRLGMLRQLAGSSIVGEGCANFRSAAVSPIVIAAPFTLTL